MEHQISFLPRVEALRGLAALAVLAFHCAGMIFDIYAMGMAPVVVFFVLSGFLLAKSLDRDPDPWTFLRHRAFRLLPAATATVALLTLLYWQFGFYMGYLPSFEPLNVVLNALMLRHDINGGMWSLTVEIAAIPVILICHPLFMHYGPAPLIGIGAILFGLSWYGPYVHVFGGFTNLAPLYSFVVGMLAYFYADTLRKRVSRPQAIEIAALVLIVIAGCRKQTGYTILIETFTAAALLVLSASSSSKTLLAKALDSALLKFVGKISYSFFLIHMLGVFVVWKWILPRFEPVFLYTALLALFGGAAALPMAWLMWRLVEVPFIRLGRRPFRTAKSLSAYSR